MPPSREKDAASAKAPLTGVFIGKLNEFILINIELYRDKSEEKQKQYFDFIQKNIQFMNPLFFSAGEDFMNLVFKKTDASDAIKETFIERWNTLRKLCEKIYEFVKLQINLLVRKDPEKDQQAWKDFIMENISLMNEEFFRLGKKVFIHLLDQAVVEDVLRSGFIDAWDKTTETVLNLKNIPQKN